VITLLRNACGRTNATRGKARPSPTIRATCAPFSSGKAKSSSRWLRSLSRPRLFCRSCSLTIRVFSPETRTSHIASAGCSYSARWVSQAPLGRAQEATGQWRPGRSEGGARWRRCWRGHCPPKLFFSWEQNRGPDLRFARRAELQDRGAEVAMRVADPIQAQPSRTPFSALAAADVEPSRGVVGAAFDGTPERLPGVGPATRCP